MILYLDTSGEMCKVWLDEDYTEYRMGRELARDLLGVIQKRVGHMRKLTGIAFMKGAGSFTGLRIGATAANTMAEYLGVPIVGEKGPTWRARAKKRLSLGENDKMVLPEYDKPANVTKPKK